jgi:hypothetical protein
VNGPLNPVQVEAKLRSLVNDLGSAQQALARARDAEVDAKHDYERARRRALLGGDAPKVSRGGFTTAERDAWVDDKTEAAKFAYDKAAVVRETAQDHLRTLRDQAECVRSLGASVRMSYELAGVGQP